MASCGRRRVYYTGTDGRRWSIPFAIPALPLCPSAELLPLGSYATVTGSNNSALGYSAGPDIGSPNLGFATAIGAGAIVSQSNALVVGGPRGSGSAVNAGIGIATPSHVFTIAQGAGPAIADGWSVCSSRRWKTKIQTLQSAMEKVEKVRGVSRFDGHRQTRSRRHCRRSWGGAAH